MRTRIALAVLGALATLSAQASGRASLFDDTTHGSEPRRGFYWGFDLGQSAYDLDRADLDSQLADTLQLAGINVLSGSSETSEDGFTYGIILGWQFLPWLAVEAAYVDLGDAEYKSNTVITDGVTTADLRTTLTAESAGPTLSALGILPLGKGWDIYGRVGAYFGSNDATAAVSLDGIPADLDDSSSSQTFLWGGGVGYTRGHWTARLDYQKFTDVGDDNGFGEVDVDRITFAGLYRFGDTFSRSKATPTAAPVVAAAAAPAVAAAAAPADSDGDGVADSIDQCPNTPAGERVGPFGCSCDVSVQLNFAFDSAELTADDKAKLDGVAARLRELQFVGGEVAGHTDSIGDEAYNIDLSRRRAQAVLDYLAAQGVAPGRMTAVGYGESAPIADNATEEGRAQNRRVVIRRTDCDATG
jgi:outer membrane protein OmpA-like peptidoglycan-associated protein